MSFLSSIASFGRKLEHDIQEVGQTIVKTANNVEKTVEQTVSNFSSNFNSNFNNIARASANDFSTMFLRQQLQSLSPVGAAAISASTTKTSNSFLNGLGNFLSNAASNLVASTANSLVSLLPSSLIQTGFSLASKYFGGQGGQGFDQDLASHLASFGYDPRALSSAKVFYNSPNAISGYATTLGNDIHFGDKPDPKYWVAATELQNLIKSNAPAGQIHAAQDKLRKSINDFALIAHETKHVEQYQRYGSTGFAAKYASDFAGGFANRVLDQVLSGNFNASKVFDLNDKNAPLGGAYRGVGFEQEAYNFQRNVVTPTLEKQYASLLSYARTSAQVASDSAKFKAIAPKCNCPGCQG